MEPSSDPEPLDEVIARLGTVTDSRPGGGDPRTAADVFDRVVVWRRSAGLSRDYTRQHDVATPGRDEFARRRP